MNEQLPPRPDEFRPVIIPAPAPKKRWTGWKIAGAIFLGLIILGAVGDLTGSNDTTSTSNPVVAPVGETVTGSDSGSYDYAQAADYMRDATHHINAITATSSFSEDEANLNAVAADYTMAAGLVDPVTAGYLLDAASYTRTAADYVADGDYDSAAPYIDKATNSLDQANTYMESVTP